jgi:hypothetical protein
VPCRFLVRAKIFQLLAGGGIGVVIGSATMVNLLLMMMLMLMLLMQTLQPAATFSTWRIIACACLPATHQLAATSAQHTRSCHTAYTTADARI